MKIGVSLYSFHEYAGNDRIGIKGCLDKAKELGIEGVDFIDASFDNHADYLAYAKDIGDYCKQIGIEAVCFCTGSDFLNGSGGNLDAEIEKTFRKAEIAAAYGCKLMRHDATGGYPSNIKFGRGFDDALPILVKAYRAVTEFAEKLNVKTCVENHGFFAQDANRIEKLVNAVGHRNFGALVDIGNFCCADEENAVSTGLLAPYAFHAHAKDFHKKSGMLDNPGEGWFQTRGANYIRGSIIGHGEVPIRQCINALRRGGYDGYLTIEFEGMEDPIRGISVGYANLKRILG